VNLRFDCPVCGHAARLDVLGSIDWQCPACDHLVHLQEHAGPGALHPCVVCSNPELYKKKDFPHWLGMTILTVACLASLIPYMLYQIWLTWAILIGSAIFDGLLYLWVRDVLVCYRCGAQYRGLLPREEYKPFDLGIGERYRQERIRREQLQANRVLRTKD
jgi:hypothetical protein